MRNALIPLLTVMIVTALCTGCGSESGSVRLQVTTDPSPARVYFRCGTGSANASDGKLTVNAAYNLLGNTPLDVRLKRSKYRGAWQIKIEADEHEFVEASLDKVQGTTTLHFELKPVQSRSAK